jgi:hypothetical protein
MLLAALGQHALLEVWNEASRAKSSAALPIYRLNF